MKKTKINKKQTITGMNHDEHLLEPNITQSMADSEQARELTWIWDESVHKYVRSIDDAGDDLK